VLPADDGSGLYLSPVPVPTGDPAALAKAASTFTAAHGEISRNHATLTGPVWQGTGAAAYLTSVHDLTVTYALTATALASGATALHAYAGDLRTAQDTARRANAAVATANAAATAMLGAQATADQSRAAATDAAQTSATADAQAAASPHSPTAHTAATTARTAATQAQATAQSDAGRLSSLSAAWATDRSHALSLCSLAQQQASHAATKAGAAFDAAATALMGKTAKPVRGGATGVAGGESSWQKLSDDMDTVNDDAGWGLNSLNAFGAIFMSKAEVVYLEAQAGLSKSITGYDTAVEAVLADKGFFSSGFYPATNKLNEAFGARRAANSDLMDSIRPATSDKGLLATGTRGLLVLGMVSDLWTMKDPAKSFGPGDVLGGNTDRVMAGANLAASGVALGASMDVGLATAAMAIPGVDVVVGAVLIGTAVYFGGEFVYAHWDDISHAASTATHAVGTALSDTGHFAENEISSAGHDLKKAFSWL
jgi:hypothetical protein